MAKRPAASKPIPTDTARTPPQGRAAVVPGMASMVQGFQAPPPGTFATYRQMRQDPTIALGRAVALCPIRAAEWTYEKGEKGDPTPEMLELVESVIGPMKRRLLTDGLRGVEYGFQPFERIWKAEGGRLTFRLKPLLPDKTKILVDKETGAFAGIENGRAELSPVECFVYTHDMEAGDFYGRSRYENIREAAWAPSKSIMDQLGRYVTKVAGIIPIMKYPVGESKDKFGNLKDNADIATEFLSALGGSRGVAMPMTLASWAQDLLRAGIPLKDVAAWTIEFLQANGTHGSEFIEELRYCDSLKLRGLLVPERAALEGQFGTKAEAGEHADVALCIATETLAEFIQHVNWYVVDPLLEANFGPEARGLVEVRPAPLRDEDKEFFRAIVTQVLVNPMNADLLQAVADFDAMLDRSGVPIQTDEDEGFVPLLPADPAAPVPEGDPAAPVAPGTEAVADTAFTGIQIEQLKELAKDVAAGVLPIDAARAIAQVAFPTADAAKLEAIFRAVQGFVPRPQPVAASRSAAIRRRTKAAIRLAGGESGLSALGGLLESRRALGDQAHAR